MRHAQVAKSVRDNKEKRPEYYCSNPLCLFRTVSGRTGEFTDCPKHPTVRQWGWRQPSNKPLGNQT